jgi:TonB-linked SusC/RagA family outer membrane protein
MNKKHLTVLLLVIFSCFAATGQINIRGKVIDDAQEPVIGASVLEKGTGNGTVTDINGNFLLTVKNEKSSLVVSYVGMVTKTLTVGKNTNFTIELTSSAVELQEVVAIGYGNVRKSDLTGSVSSVKVKDAETVPVVTVDQFLKGKASGVYVNTASAEPGGVTSVKIRGINSLSSSTTPLYVVDGVVMSMPSGGGDPFNRAQQSLNPLSYLSPQDIVSMEVLKDASATAIYGSRGANGVILITTKSGEAGKTRVNLTSNFNFSTIRKRIDVLDGPDFARYRNETRLNDGSTTLIYGLQESAGVTATPRPEDVIWRNWQDEMLQTAFSNSTRVSVSGGAKTTNYYFSLGTDQNQGIVKNTDFNRYDMRLNFNADLSKSVKLSLNISGASVDSKLTQTTGSGGNVTYSAIRSMISRNPILNVMPGDSPDVLMLNSPTAWLKDYKDDNTESTVTTKMGLNVKISKVFSYDLQASYRFRQSERFRYFGRTIGGYATGAAGYSSVRYYGIDFDNLLNFDYSFNDANRISGVAGVTYTTSDTRSMMYMASGFSDDVLGYEAIGTATSISTPLTRNRTPASINSFLARVTYSLKDRYLITATGREDGNSRFAPGHKYGFFPSFAFAWRAKEESFLKDVEKISNLKLRLGWGLTGNPAINAYDTQKNYDSQYVYTYNGSSVTAGAINAVLANKDLKWESQEQFNAGVDFGMFNERISLSLDVYNKQSNDMLIRRPLPYSSGFDNGIVNFGSLQNNGFDFSGNFVLVDNKTFKLSVDGNISVYRNKIMKLGLPVSSMTGYVAYTGGIIHPIGEINLPGNIFIEGKPAALFWGYKTDGIYQNQAQIDAFTKEAAERNGTAENKTTWYHGRAPIPGEIIYADKNGDGIINSYDYDIIGDPNPDFVWGGGINMNYRNWGLSALFNGVQGKDVLNVNLNSENRLNGSIYNVRKKAWDERWHGEGTSNYYPLATAKLIGSIVSDRLVEDASFIRLSNITLSYNPSFGNGAFVKDLKIFVTANNFLTITKYSGFDPEVDSFGGDATRSSMDNNSYPSAKSIVFGFNINF